MCLSMEAAQTERTSDNNNKDDADKQLQEKRSLYYINDKDTPVGR